MKKLPYYVKDIFVICFLSSLLLLFFFDVLFQGKTLFTGDNMSLNIPGKYLIRDFFRGLEPPYWNPYMFSGMPFLADINFGFFTPLNLFYFMFDPFKAHTLNVIFGLWFGSISMYLYCRKINLSRTPSLVSAILFMFSGSVFVNVFNTSILNVVMWLPIILFFLEEYLLRGSFRYGLLVSVLCSLQLYGGHIQYTYYSWLLICAYVLLRVKPFSFFDTFKRLSTIFIPVLFLTAVQLVPFLEFARFTTRPQQDITYSAGATPLVSYIRLILPNFFGVLKDGTSWGATADISGFVGIIPLFLVVFFVFRTKNFFNFFYLGVAIISFLMSLGRYSLVFYFAYYVLPFYSRFRSPATVLILYTFSLSILTGFALNYLFKTLKKKSVSKVSLVVFIVLIICLMVILALKSFGYFYLIKFFHFINNSYFIPFVSRFLEYSSFRRQTIYSLWLNNLILNVFFLSLFVLITHLATRQKKFLRFYKGLLVLLISSELMYYAGTIHISAKQELLNAPRNIYNIFNKDKSYFRIYTLKDEPKKPIFGDRDYFIKEAVKSMSFMQPDSNIFYGAQSIDGYTSMVYKPYANFVMKTPVKDPTGIEIINPSEQIIDELNVKYVLTAGRYLKELQSNGKYQLVYSYKHSFLNRTFYVFQNKSVKPRVEIIDNPVASVSIIEYKPNMVRIQTKSDSPSVLLLRDIYYPGWEVTINNKREQVKPYGIFRSVKVSEGKSDIKMVFKPKSYIVSSLVSLLSWILMAHYLLFSFFKQKKKIGAKLHITKRKIKKNTR